MPEFRSTSIQRPGAAQPVQAERVDIDSLRSDPANARRHGRRNIETIESSLRRFGQQKPIVVDADGVVIAGNGTLAAARRLGWRQIDVVRSDLTGADRAAYAVADNRTAELAEWDEAALAAALAALKQDESFDHLVTGFDDKEIDGLVRRAMGEAAEPQVPECFQVVIECADEAEQRRLFERLTAEGLRCRLLVL